MLPEKIPSKQSTVAMAGRGYVDTSPQKSSSQSFNFSPQKLAALNSRYVSVSLKAADLDKVLDAKRMEHDRLDEKIKGLELARLTLENDKGHILLQIRDVRSQPSPSSSPSKVGYSLPKSYDIRSFSSPSFGRGAFTSTSATSIVVSAQHVKKEYSMKQADGGGFEGKQMKKTEGLGFEDDDDDDELEKEMLKIDTQQEPAQKKKKFADGKDM